MAPALNLVGSISPGLGIAVLSGAVVAYLLLRVIYNLFFHPLAKIPGPVLMAVTDIPFLYYRAQGAWPHKVKELHDRYGPVVRITDDDVSFITPAAVKTIYGHRAAGQETYQKDHKVYRPSSTGYTSILIANDADHRRQRRLLAHAFSEKALRGQEDVMKRYVGLLIAKMRECARSAEPVIDMVKWYNFTTFDLIGDLAFGQPFGCLESGGYHPWVAMIFANVKVASLTGAVLRYPRLKPLISLFISEELVRSQKEHNELSARAARRRLESGNTAREDFMSYILRHNDEKGMSEGEIVENANLLIIAGSETTATQLSGTTFFLLSRGNEARYKRVVDEIRGRFQSEEDIDLISLQGMEYMNACFEEAMRMYPPVPIASARRTPGKGEVIEGYYIPGDTGVSVPQLAAFRNERNFKNPDKFVPERWLGDSEYKDDVRTMLQPFLTGPRNCIGKNLAYAEMRLIFAHVLWNFDLELMPECENWDQQKIYTFWTKGDLKVRLKPVQRE